MRTALIGHTGFVGGVLAAAQDFDDCYNSKNVTDMVGRRYDLVLCAGVSAAKWIANEDPEKDWAAIARLLSALDRVDAREVVLISTIDVYPEPAAGLDEAAHIDRAGNHAYGRNRLRLEDWVAGRFPIARVVRLPALFGPGLKKNALYDLLHDNMVDRIDPAAEFQWYPVRRLRADIERIRARDLRLVNLFTEPLSMARIIDGYFPSAPVGRPAGPAPRYRLKSRHAADFGGRDGYIMTADACYAAIGEFVAEARMPAW